MKFINNLPMIALLYQSDDEMAIRLSYNLIHKPFEQGKIFTLLE